MKPKKRIRKFCECGCGGLTNRKQEGSKHEFNRFIIGHNRRGTTFKLTAGQRQKIAEANKRRTLSEETKKKIGVANTGKRRTEECKKRLSKARKGVKKSPKHVKKMIGRKQLEETKKKISEANKGRVFSEEHLFNMNKAFIKRMKEVHSNGYCGDFSQDLKDYTHYRDGYKCVHCGMLMEESLEKWNEKLTVHHIDEDKFNNVPDNLETCCKVCHKKEHWKNIKKSLKVKIRKKVE